MLGRDMALVPASWAGMQLRFLRAAWGHGLGPCMLIRDETCVLTCWVGMRLGSLCAASPDPGELASCSRAEAPLWGSLGSSPGMVWELIRPHTVAKATKGS